MASNIPWHHIDTVLFDMDGTLLDLHFDNHFWIDYLPQRYAQIHGLDEALIKPQLAQQFAAIRGQLNWYSVDYWSETLNVDIEALKIEMNEKIAFRDHALEFLHWLREHNKTIILATNAHRKALELKLAKATMRHLFKAMVSSHDYGIPKEQDGFWQRLVEAQHVDLSRCAFFDDSLEVLRSAKRNGVAHVYAIPNPDSTQPSKDTAEFYAVPDFRAIMTFHI